MERLVAFLTAVADRWAFWIGLLLMIEPFSESAFPVFAARIKRVLADDRRKMAFRIAGAIALFVACFQAWDEQFELAAGNVNRLAMKDLIGTAINEGAELSKTHKSSKEASDAVSYQHAAEIWATKTGP